MEDRRVQAAGKEWKVEVRPPGGTGTRELPESREAATVVVEATDGSGTLGLDVSRDATDAEIARAIEAGTGEA